MNDNRAAFGKLINDHQNKIFHVAMGMLGNRDEALDITQEVFLKAFKSYNDFRFNSSFETWLIRITINKVYSGPQKRDSILRCVSQKKGGTEWAGKNIARN